MMWLWGRSLTALAMGHQMPWFLFNFYDPSHYGNPGFLGAHYCPYPNAGALLHPHDGVTSGVCAPRSNGVTGSNGCDYTWPPDYTGNHIDHLSGDHEDWCAMKCQYDYECSPTSASECHRFTGWLNSVCLHPGGNQGVYYNLGSVTESDPNKMYGIVNEAVHVTVKGTYTVQGVIFKSTDPTQYGTSNFGNTGHQLRGDMTIELGVSIYTHHEPVGDDHGLIVCDATSGERLRLYHKNTETTGKVTLIWEIHGGSVSGHFTPSDPGVADHIVITMEGDQMRLHVNNDDAVYNGTGTLPIVLYENCKIGVGVWALFSSLSIHPFSMSHADVHAAYGAFLTTPAASTPVPTPAPTAESKTPNTGLLIAAIVAGVFATGICVAAAVAAVIIIIVVLQRHSSRPRVKYEVASTEVPTVTRTAIIF